MIDILSHYQSYRPDIEDYRLKVSGDGLTCMRAREAIAGRKDGHDEIDQLRYFFVGSDDWHEQGITLGVRNNCCLIYSRYLVAMWYTLIFYNLVLERDTDVI